MSKFSDCIGDSNIPKDQKDEIVKEFDSVVAGHVKNGMPEDAAEVMAANVVAGRRSTAAKAKKLAHVHNIRVLNEHQEKINTLSGRELSEYAREQVREGYMVGTNGILHALQAPLADMIDASNRRFTGSYMKSTKQFDDIPRGLYGEDIPERARGWVDGIKKADELREKVLEAAGIHLPKDPTYRLPQTAVPHKMSGEVNMKSWLEFHGREGAIDWDNMGDFLDGRVLPTDKAGRLEVLEDVYHTLTTGGAHKNKTGRRSVASKWQHRRFIRYQTADSWLEANRKFGNDDIFGLIFQNLELVARDASLMQSLTTNPKVGLDQIGAMVANRAGRMDIANKVGGSNKGEQAKAKSNNLAAAELLSIAMKGQQEESLGYYTGAVIGLTNVITSAKLTLTALKALPTDTGTRLVTKRSVGLPASVTFLKQLFSKANKADAVFYGAGAHGLIRTTLAADRMLGEVSGDKISRAFPELTVRATGLNLVTNVGRHHMKLDSMRFFGKNANKKLGELPERTQKWFKEYGITEGDWDILRATPVVSDRNGGILPLGNLFEREDISSSEAMRVFRRFSYAVDSITEQGVPTMTLEARRIKGELLDPKTATGATVRSTMQFFGFSLSMMFLHIKPHLQKGLIRGTRDFAPVAVALTTAGAVINQVNNIFSDRDLEPMDNAEFWIRASANGGAWGLVGDFLTRGKDIVVSPTIRFVGDVQRLISKGIKMIETGDSQGLSGETAWLAYKMTPLIDAWMTRWATRPMMENIISMIDPETAEDLARKARNQANRMGLEQTREWGELPNRLPKLTESE